MGCTAFVVEAPLAPAPTSALLDERRRLGLDHFDEMWDGVLHMNPPPNRRHQLVATRLVRILGPVADSLDLELMAPVGMYTSPTPSSAGTPIEVWTRC